MEHNARNFRLVASFQIVAILGFFLAQNAFADLNGRSGRSGLTGSTCTGCHSNAASRPTVTFTAGPTSVMAGSVSNFTVTISGGPGMNGSIDVAANGGMLAATGAGTQLLNGEVVHDAPKPFTAGSATYSFDWTAPPTAGSVTLFVAGMSDNGDGATSGDGTTLTTRVMTVTGGTTTPVTAANPGGPYTGMPGVAVQFSGAASTGSIASYVWNFGDGTATVSGVSPTHVYATAGTFQVTLTVTSTTGTVNANRTTVTVGATAEPSAGEVLYEDNCAGCHGDAGPGPSIFGESVEDIMDAFAEYPDEHAGVSGLLDEEIAAIAEFLNAPPDTSVGQALYEENCAGCHSDGGPGPSIFGESYDDILEAFEEYPDDHVDVSGLPDEDIMAIAEFLNACGEEEEEDDESFAAGLLSALDDDDDEESSTCGAGGAAAFGDGSKNQGTGNGHPPKGVATAAGTIGGLELLSMVGLGLMWAGRRRKK